MGATIKAVLGCNLGCQGCLPAGTKITMADGGLRNIEDIQIGDYVWSYRIADDKLKLECGQVVKLYSHQASELIELQWGPRPRRTLRLTPEHPVWTERGWRLAGDLIEGEAILRVWHSFSGERLDYKAIAKKVSATRKERIAAGIFHCRTITGDGRRRLSQRMTNGNPMRDQEARVRMQQTMRRKRQNGEIRFPVFTEQHRRNSSERMRTNNPMKGHPERVAQVIRKGNLTRIKQGRIGKGQVKIQEILQGLGINSELEFNVGRRFIDVAVPELKKGIEYDAWWGHFTPEGRERDTKRDTELLQAGWELLHLGPNEPYYPEVIPRIQEFLGLHSNSRGYVKIRSIKRIESEIDVFNFAVQPNENYIPRATLRARH